MANIKPVETRSGHWSKEDKENRRQAEESLRGTSISDKAPSRLSRNGKKVYKHLLSTFPNGFLTESDSYTLEIVANAIDIMQQCQIDIKQRGIYLEDTSENPSHRIYEKYCKIFNQFAGKLGMSPRDRAALSALLVNQQAEEEDPLIKALRGDGDEK